MGSSNYERLLEEIGVGVELNLGGCVGTIRKCISGGKNGQCLKTVHRMVQRK